MTDSADFSYISHFDCSLDEIYSYHSRSGALERLIPPWEKTSVVKRKGGIDPGGEVVMKMHAGIIPFHWVARHVENRPGEMFRDIMDKGPFSSWSHTHTFSSTVDGAKLKDQIEYSLPFHRFLPQKFKNHIDTTLLRTFQHREKVLQEDLALHSKYGSPPKRVLVSGASGVLGKALLPLLTTGGHEVWTLVRRKPDENKREIFWDPIERKIGELPCIDAVIHLAGEYIGLGRWTDEKKKAVVESRTEGTDFLARTFAAMPDPPDVFLSASAVGYYGDTGVDEVKESESCGDDFISEVCSVWEEAAKPAEKAGIRTVLMRIGISLSPGGGALQRLLRPSFLGFFKRFGEGDQYISWISIDDTVSAIYHAMCCDKLEGPVNIAAPYPVTNAEFMRTLSEVTGRPCTVPVPAALLTAIYGQMAKEILLSGCCASSEKLVKSGYSFRHETLQDALRDLLGKFKLKVK